MDLETLKNILELSFTGGILLIVLYGVWKALSVFVKEFIVPVRESITTNATEIKELVTGIKEITVSHGTLLKNHSDVLDSQVAVNRHQNQVLNHLSEQSDKDSEVLSRIDKNVKDLHDSSQQFFKEQHREHQDKYNDR